MKQIKAASRKHAASVADKYIREDGTDPNRPKPKRIRLVVGRPEDDDAPMTRKKDEPGPGRPTKYKPEFVQRAKRYYEAGLTDLEVCAKFAVSTATLYLWKRRYPEFSQASKMHGAIVDDRMEAVAASCAAKAAEDPAYIRSLEFWLKNRKREVYNRGPVDATTPINMQINFPFTISELAKATPKQLEQLQTQLAKFNPSFVQAHQGMLIDATATRVETAQRALDDHSISDDEAFGGEK